MSTFFKIRAWLKQINERRKSGAAILIQKIERPSGVTYRPVLVIYGLLGLLPTYIGIVKFRSAGTPTKKFLPLDAVATLNLPSDEYSTFLEAAAAGEEFLDEMCREEEYFERITVVSNETQS